MYYNDVFKKYSEHQTAIQTQQYHEQYSIIEKLKYENTNLLAQVKKLEHDLQVYYKAIKPSDHLKNVEIGEYENETLKERANLLKEDIVSLGSIDLMDFNLGEKEENENGRCHVIKDNNDKRK